MQPGYTVSLVARQYDITPSLLFKWKRLMNEGGKSAIVAGDEVVSVSEVQALEKKSNSLNKCWAARRWKPKSIGTRLR